MSDQTSLNGGLLCVEKEPAELWESYQSSFMVIINYFIDFPNNANFRGTIRRVEYMVSGIPHVPHSVPQIFH